MDAFNKRASSKDGLRPTCRACDAITKKIYYLTHKRISTPYASLSEEKKAKNRLRATKWNKANKAKRTLAMSKRRALQKGNGIYLVTDQEIKKIQNSLCFYCGGTGGEIDHVLPLTKGGAHSIGNLVPACRACNSSKNNLFLIEWKIKRGATHQPTSE